MDIGIFFAALIAAAGGIGVWSAVHHASHDDVTANRDVHA